MLKNMKTYHSIYIFLLLILSSCYQSPEESGFLSDDIYLKGGDTLYLPLGGKGSTDYAWLDNSSQPCRFVIENIRDEQGNRSEQFFQEYLYRTWIKPYDFLRDDTEEAVMAKLAEVQKTPFLINEINGQIMYLETTSHLTAPGDIYYVDVRVANRAGSKLFKDYAVVKLTSTTRPYTVNEVINGICVVKEGGTNFPYYDQINDAQPDFLERRNNIYEDNGKEFVRIRKLNNEPDVGVRIYIKIQDKNGNLFDPAQYATYAAGTYSYIDHAINRDNTPQGLYLEFPVTPWPVDVNMRSYLRGPTYPGLDHLDMAALKAAVMAKPTLSLVGMADWPSNDWSDAQSWYVRIRSLITFYESGTWEIEVKVPFTSVN
jgi:hypothetical protein